MAVSNGGYLVRWLSTLLLDFFKKGTREMNDYALPLVVLRRLSREYEDAMQKKKYALAYQIANDLVEMALKLQDLADD